MPDHILERRVGLPRPRGEVFAFFADPANLARITPPWLGFRLLTERPVMAPYAVLDYRVRWLGLPVSWRTMIREYDPPARFVDVQVRGPYDRWEDRKSTRLNSSHSQISYAVFCLKKKKQPQTLHSALI